MEAFCVFGATGLPLFRLAPARLFHTLQRRVRARGLQPGCALVGRVPSRGAVWAFPSESELSRLASHWGGFGVPITWLSTGFKANSFRVFPE